MRADVTQSQRKQKLLRGFQNTGDVTKEKSDSVRKKGGPWRKHHCPERLGRKGRVRAVYHSNRKL